MSLEDKFYPPDGNYLTKFDNSMIRAMGKVGEAYQEMTGKAYTGLLKPLYTVAAVGCLVGVLPANPLAALTARMLYNDYARNPPAHSPLEEEMQHEATGQPKYSGKIFRAACLTIAPLFMLAENYRTHITQPEGSTTYDSLIATGLTIYVYSLFTFALTDYLAKSNIPKPPKESLPRRMLSSLKALVSVPTPVTNQ